MRASAGTDVVIDMLVFQRREPGQSPAGAAWIGLAPVEAAAADDEADDTGSQASPGVQVNRYFAEHPEMVLGEHALRRGIYGPGLDLHLPAAQGRRGAGDFADRSARPVARRHLHRVRRVPGRRWRWRRRRDGVARGHRGGRRHDQGRLLSPRQVGPTDADRGRRSPRRGDQVGQGQRRHPCPRREDHPRPAADPRRGARGAARPGGRPALGRGAGPAAHRLRHLRARLRADQPHRRLGHDRSGDRRGAGDPSPAEPGAIRRRSRLLAGRQHRGLRPRKRPRPHGADLPRAGDRPAGRAADRDRGRRARRHPQRDRPRGHRPPGRAAGPRSGDRARPARRNGVPQSGDRSLGDGRRLSLGFRPHQAGDRRGGGRARPAVCAQRRRAAAGAARGPAAVGHHRAARRAVDSRRRHRGVRRRGDGHRDDACATPSRSPPGRWRPRRSPAPPPAPPNGAPRGATPAGCCTTR